MPAPPLPSRFRFIRQLGEGGMGVVYEAVDEENGSRVALKTVRDLTADSLARFKREFRALADVHHPNVVTLGELFSEGGDWFFSMELVEGDDFLGYVRPQDQRWQAVDMPVSGEQSIATSPTLRFTHAQDPSATPVDEGRLRSALRQLVDALAALHAAGIVHRDVKPSNVRVTPDGRLVLLDFGLASDAAKNRSTAANVCGTPAYMAPEQAMSGAVGPEADWYSVGVVLYEALTGVAPFDGTALEIVMKKQSDTPAAPRSLRPEVPADLDALCVALLQFDPKARPTASRIQRALGGRETPGSSVSHSSLVEQTPFVGRAAELRELHAAFRDTREGSAVSVLVEGESGVGKSCLVRRFVTTLAAQYPDLVVLTGRCYEREAVPYKALDGVVDSLAQLLVRERHNLADRVIPTRPGPLAHVFPVLRRIEAFANMKRGPSPVADPFEVRTRAFAALREMLVRLATTRPCVVVIDDLQWADADSLALLAEIMRPPEEPPLLLVATIRAAPPEATAAAQNMAELHRFIGLALAGRARSIAMTRMSEADARTLAAQLIKREASGALHSADEIAREAAGHPLFIDALVRHSAIAGASSALLEDALWARIASLAAGPRRVMHLLAVAGKPVTQEVLADALQDDRADLPRHVSLLRVAHLASITGARANDTVEPYHDRVRAAVLGNIDEAERVDCHRALALALEHAPRLETEALARHWRGAGNLAQAARYSAQAADEAAGALAFDRAATLYETAIELGPHIGAPSSELFEKLGDALANAGRGERAAAAYAEASRDAQAARSLDLQRRAADQLLRAGHFDSGLQAMMRVLASIDVSLPRSPLASLFFLVVYRLYLRVRGLGFRPRDVSQIKATDITRMDVCWSLAFGLGLTDTVRGAAFHARNLSLALRSGERFRVARAVALEAGFVSCGGGRSARRTQALLVQANALATESGEPYAIGWAHGAAGVAHYLSGRFRLALEHTERSKATFEEVPGAAWELDTAVLFCTNSMAQLGQLERLAKETPKALREARQRGDLYAAVNLRLSLANMTWLAADDAAGSLAQVDEAIAEWSKDGFHVEHYYEILSRTDVLLYSGRARDARDYVHLRWPAFRRSLLPFNIQSVLVSALHARARCAVAVAEEGSPQRDALLRDATSCARRIERERMGWCTPWAKLIRAGVAMANADRESSSAHLRAALAGFEAADMALYAAAARRYLGKLVAGDAGETMVRDAEKWMSSETIKNPARMTAMLAPGFGRLG